MSEQPMRYPDGRVTFHEGCDSARQSSANPAGFPAVQGYCPACRGESLFLAAGGHVTCSRLDCPDPCAADDALARNRAGGPPTDREPHIVERNRIVSSLLIEHGKVKNALRDFTSGDAWSRLDGMATALDLAIDIALTDKQPCIVSTCSGRAVHNDLCSDHWREFLAWQEARELS